MERVNKTRWTPYAWFPWVEHRTVIFGYGDGRHSRVERRWRPKAVPPAPKPVPTPSFDWLRDYGPLWEPGSAAFWLAPENPMQFEACLRKYRPNSYGEFCTEGCYGGVLYARIVRHDPDVIPHPTNPYAQMAMQNYLNQLNGWSGARNAAHDFGANNLHNYIQNHPQNQYTASNMRQYPHGTSLFGALFGSTFK